MNQLTMQDGSEHHAMLVRSARLLAAAVSREELFEGLARIVKEELGVCGFSLYEVDTSRPQVRELFRHGFTPVDTNVTDVRFWQTRTGDAVLQNTPFFVGSLSRDLTPDDENAARQYRDAGIAALAVLPLFVADVPRGALVLRYPTEREFPENERRLLTDFATQVSVALRNAGYIAALEDRASRLAALSEAQQRLTGVTEEQTLPAAVADAVTAVFPRRDCDIFFTSPRGLSRKFALRGNEPVGLPEPPEEELDVVRAAFVTGVPRLALRVASGLELPRGTTELCTAVRFGDRSVGVLRVLASHTVVFEMQDLDLMSILARYVGTAYETVRLFTAQDLQRRRAEAAAEIARAALHAVTLQDGVSRLLRVLERVVPSSGKAIGIARSRDAGLEFVVATGSLANLRHLHVDSAAVVSLAVGTRAMEVESLQQVAAPRLAAAAPDEWGYIVPLGARERTVGMVIVSMPKHSALDRSARTTLDRLTASLSLALDALLLDEEEQSARERETTLATALTTINHPIFLLDANDAITYANPAAAREYKFSQHELVGMQFSTFVADVVEREGHAFNEAIVERGLSLAEHVHRRSDGTEFPAAVTVSELGAPDGAKVVSVRNMTSERAVADQLRHTEKMVALGELVAGVAHEINNPLTGISAFAQLLLEDSLTGEQRESVELIKRESDRAKAVIRDLLIFARKAEPVTGPVDINALIEQTLRLRAYQLRNAGIETHLELDPSVPRIRGDAQKLQQVILNVLTNAEHALSDAPRRKLSLRTMRHNNRVIIEAADTGHGMSTDVRRRVFEPFYTTKPAGIGTGLGLSVSYGIVQAHGGTIDVHSEPGVGTTIVLSLPAADVPATRPADEATPSAQST